MILDKNLEMLDAVALNTGAAGTYLIGDQIDTQGPTQISTLRGLGTGTTCYLVLNVDTDITTAGAAGTLQFKLASDDTASIATNGSATEHIVTKAFATSGTAIKAGTTLLVQELPAGDYERYMGLLQVTGTTALNAGKINAFLVGEDAAAYWKAKADAVVLGTSL